MVVSDSQSCAKVTLYEEFSTKVKEGGSYVMRGYNVRAQSPPYFLNITRDTVFFRSSALSVPDELVKQAEALLYPPSTLTPLSACRESLGLVTVEAKVVEVSAVKEVVVARDTAPLLTITIKQEETKVPVCLWREVAVSGIAIGTKVPMDWPYR
ncbi:hypothetical protein VZT92_022684 [Zoarces viviparus]|uniref:Uncharacterized protein n=1 Tax=Zoarces viviparus TaxID=48416 RepID=A0AAW1ED26_ZOAVI